MFDSITDPKRCSNFNSINPAMSSFTLLFVFTLMANILFAGQYSAAEQSIAKPQQIATLTVNINTATAEELADVMSGVGTKKAASIIAYRKTIGSFKTLEDLLGVKGIGIATLEKNRHKLKL